MTELLYSLVTGLSTFGWFIMSSVVFVLFALGMIVSARDDGSEKDRRRKSLLERADQTADRLDEAALEISGRLPGWCLDEDNKAYRSAMSAYARYSSEIQRASDELRGRVARGRSLGTEALVRSYSLEAGHILRRTRQVKEKCVRHSSKAIARSALHVLERRLSVIDEAMGKMSLTPAVRSIISDDLVRIRNQAAAFGDALRNGKDFSESGLIALLKLSVDIHEIQDLLTGFIQRGHSTTAGQATKTQS